MVDDVKLSKFLSLVLRHQPQSIGLTLEAEGWVSIDDLVRRSNDAGMPFGREDLLRVVATSDKKRFSLSADATSIRAAQGHSVAVDLRLPPRVPPDTLYHGTATRFLPAILAEGLQPRAQKEVHLSAAGPRGWLASAMASRRCWPSMRSECTRAACCSSRPTTACG